MNKFTLKKKFLSTLLLLIITFVNSSCVELENIRKFTENAAAVSEKFPELSGDIYGSCVRRYRYVFIELVNFRPDLMQKIDNLSEVENLDGYPTVGIPRDSSGLSIIQHELKCREFKKSHKAAMLINKALVDYLKTLGELAANDLTSYDKSLDQLGTSVTSIGVFEEKHINAGKGLAGFILNAATEFWRRKKLKSAIEQRDKDVSTVSVVLKKYIAEEYVRMLNIEKEQMDGFYTELIRNYQAQPNVNQLTVLMFKNEWDAKTTQLKDKIEAAQAYGKIMENVIAGHHKLYEFRESLNSKEVRQMALQYAKNIGDLIGTFRKAFK